MRDWVEIGHIVRAHGVRGELRVACDADSVDLLKEKIYLPEPYTVRDTRRVHGALLIGLEEISSREEAEALAGRKIRIPRQRLPQLPEGEFYLGDLPGLRVWIQEDQEDPAYLGLLDRAELSAGQEIWTILTPEGKEVLFPAVNAFVREISPETGKAVICPPPGLLDLYLHEN